MTLLFYLTKMAVEISKVAAATGPDIEFVGQLEMTTASISLQNVSPIPAVPIFLHRGVSILLFTGTFCPP